MLMTVEQAVHTTHRREFSAGSSPVFDLSAFLRQRSVSDVEQQVTIDQTVVAKGKTHYLNQKL